MFSTVKLCTLSMCVHSPQSEEYSSWLAGCKMVMKGRSLARTGYDQELASIRSFVAMQNRADPSGGPADQVGSEEREGVQI